ncbi:MAG: hypothetical protein ACI4OH_05205 [Mitsuokella sp.]|uniref:hypothetical protein n=1 Tax=Mitsuokella sp. TaxID=2049034 RepID=UPI003EFE77D2
MSYKQNTREKIRELKQEIKATEDQLYITQRNLEKAKGRARINKLIRVGLIVEQAGLLDSYSEYDLYLLLVQNRDYLTKKTKQMVPPIQFKT